MHHVFKVIENKPISIGQQRKRRDARHQAKMSRIADYAHHKPTGVGAVRFSSVSALI